MKIVALLWFVLGCFISYSIYESNYQLSIAAFIYFSIGAYAGQDPLQ